MGWSPLTVSAAGTNAMVPGDGHALLAAGGCGGQPVGAAPPAPPPTDPSYEEPQFITYETYEGLVFEPMREDPSAGSSGYDGRKGIPEVRVTIIGGQVDGWTACVYQRR